MLILFDIDATLITTARCGIQAMGDAGRAMFGPSFDEQRVPYAGRLDPVIIRELLVLHEQSSDHEAVRRFRDGYRVHLSRLLDGGWYAKPCPGVLELLDRLQNQRSHTLGLLTGNFPETGKLKLAACGVDPDRFTICVWGEDSPHEQPAREHLPPIGMARYRATFGREIPGSHVTIIGDTPHDVSCAKAHGCRVLGVGTGQFSVDDLNRAGADRAVADLSHTEEIARWLLNN